MSYVQRLRQILELYSVRLMEFHTRNEEKSRAEQCIYEMSQLGIRNEVQTGCLAAQYLLAPENEKKET